MLTKMPQVGDKVRALQDFMDVTKGNEYEVVRVDSDGDARIIDDDGDSYPIFSGDFGKYELVGAPPAQPVGRVEIEDVRKSTAITETGHRTKYALTVYADADGYDAIERLADEYTTQGKRADLERRIAELQKELAAL